MQKKVHRFLRFLLISLAGTLAYLVLDSVLESRLEGYVDSLAYAPLFQAVRIVSFSLTLLLELFAYRRYVFRVRDAWGRTALAALAVQLVLTGLCLLAEGGVRAMFGQRLYTRAGTLSMLAVLLNPFSARTVGFSNYVKLAMDDRYFIGGLMCQVIFPVIAFAVCTPACYMGLRMLCRPVLDSRLAEPAPVPEDSAQSVRIKDSEPAETAGEVKWKA